MLAMVKRVPETVSSAMASPRWCRPGVRESRTSRVWWTSAPSRESRRGAPAGRPPVTTTRPEARVGGGAEVGDALTGPSADQLEALERHGVALDGRLGDEWPVDLVDVAAGPLEQVQATAGRRPDDLVRLPLEGAPAAVLLPAT